jgi:hypothetical protein
MESVEVAALVVPDGIQHLLEWQVESAVPVALAEIATKALRASVATVVLAALGLAEQMHSRALMVWLEPLVVLAVPEVLAVTRQAEPRVLAVLAELLVAAVLAVPENWVASADSRVTVRTVALAAQEAAQVPAARTDLVARAVTAVTAQSVAQVEQATSFLG